MTAAQKSSIARTDPARLPEAELEVLSHLWREGKATAREVREAMAPYRPMTHGAMVTLLNRLEAKGRVTREKAPIGKAYIYKPSHRPEPTYRRILGDMLRRVFGGDKPAMIANLFDTRPPTADELDQLQAMLDDFRRRSGPSRGDG